MKKKKKVKPKLPDINTGIIRHRNDALEYSKKYEESLIKLNNLLPKKYRVELKTWFDHSLYLIEKQIGKYRSDFWESQDKKKDEMP